jgi:phage baseplate assembly protein W
MANLPIGITLPFKMGNSGYFEQSYDTITQLKSNIHHFFMTMQGERPMNPLFGTKLYEIIFRNDDISIINEQCESIIRGEIRNWFQNISIDEIYFNRNFTDDGQNIFSVDIYLKFRVNVGLTQEEEIVITLTNSEVR